MASWWDKSSSLNWVNKKKLAKKLQQLDSNVSQAKEDLHALLTLINTWEFHIKEMCQKHSSEQLTAKHVVVIKPLIEKTDNFCSILKDLSTSLEPLAIKEE